MKGRKLRFSSCAKVVLFALWLMAAGAPFFAHEVPLLHWGEEGLSFPILRVLSQQDYLWASGALVFLCALGGARASKLRYCLWGMGGIALVAGVLLGLSAAPHNAAVLKRQLSEAVNATSIEPFIAHSPWEVDAEHAALGPFQSGHHLLGTDALGHDVAAQLIWGARPSLFVGFASVALAAAIGLLIGLVSGWFGGWVDGFLTWLTQVVMCFPALVLYLAMTTHFAPSTWLIVLLLGLTLWPTLARLIRAEVLATRALPFVESARAMKLGAGHIMWRHLLPYVLAPLKISATLGVATAIVLESTLAFLGISDPGLASWGALLHQGKDLMPQGMHLVLLPGGLILVTVISLQLIAGDEAQVAGAQAEPEGLVS